MASIHEVALYGTRTTGHGYIARAADGRMFGDGEPHPARGLVDAILLGLIALRDGGVAHGAAVRVYLPDEVHTFDTTVGALPSTVSADMHAAAPIKRGGIFVPLW